MTAVWVQRLAARRIARSGARHMPLVVLARPVVSAFGGSHDQVGQHPGTRKRLEPERIRDLVAIGQVRRLVVADVGLSGFSLPDQDLEWEIQRNKRPSAHQRRTDRRVAEDDQLRLAEFLAARASPHRCDRRRRTPRSLVDSSVANSLSTTIPTGSVVVRVTIPSVSIVASCPVRRDRDGASGAVPRFDRYGRTVATPMADLPPCSDASGLEDWFATQWSRTSQWDRHRCNTLPSGPCSTSFQCYSDPDEEAACVWSGHLGAVACWQLRDKSGDLIARLATAPKADLNMPDTMVRLHPQSYHQKRNRSGSRLCCRAPILV